MTDLLFGAERFATTMVWMGAVLATATMLAVTVERALFAWSQRQQQRIERAYGSIAERALGGDDAAVRSLATNPLRERWAIAGLLVKPLVDRRDPQLIARTREIVRGLGLADVTNRLLRSPWWWRRARAVRAAGLLQLTNRTAAVVAALDDRHPEVRAAALDAIADLADPTMLPALIVRLHDESLQRGRVAAALGAFGPACEPFLLEMAEVDVLNRLNYARGLSICGTSRARAMLVRWTADTNPEVRAAAFEALGHVGLDASAAPAAIRALEMDEVGVRAMAAYALHDWTGPEDAVSHLARHLDDAWPVAVRAAQSLQTLQSPGVVALQSSAGRPDLAGMLARQVLWEMAEKC